MFSEGPLHLARLQVLFAEKCLVMHLEASMKFQMAVGSCGMIIGDEGTGFANSAACIRWLVVSATGELVFQPQR